MMVVLKYLEGIVWKRDQFILWYFRVDSSDTFGEASLTFRYLLTFGTIQKWDGLPFEIGNIFFSSCGKGRILWEILWRQVSNWMRVDDFSESVCWLFSSVQLFVTPWTVARQAPLVHGILQARILEWVAISFSRESSRSRNQAWVSCIAGRFFTVWATREASRWLIYYLFSSKSKEFIVLWEMESFKIMHFLTMYVTGLRQLLSFNFMNWFLRT